MESTKIRVDQETTTHPPGTTAEETLDDSARDTGAAPPKRNGREQRNPGIWSVSYRALTIGLILTVTGTAFEALAVATIMPATAKDLGGFAYYGWAFSAFMLTNLVGVAVAGAEADRQGPLRPFILGAVLFSMGLVVGGLAPVMPVVIVGRAVQGFGGGILGSIAYVAIGRGYPEQAKPQMLAVLSTAWVVPGLISPAIAGLVAQYIGWRWVFLGLVPLPLIAMALTLPTLRRLDCIATTARDWKRVWAALQLAGGVALLITGVGLHAPLLAVPLALLVAVLGWQALRRLVPAGTMRAAPGLPAIVATSCLLNLAFFGVDAFVPLALTSTLGQTLAFAGIALTTATVGWTTGAWTQAHFARDGDRRRLVTLGLLLVALGTIGTAATLDPRVGPWVALASWGIAGLGMEMSFSTISLAALEASPKGQMGDATASVQLANMLGTALSTGSGGVLIAYVTSIARPVGTGIAIQDLLM